jgi:hypothetical protein
MKKYRNAKIVMVYRNVNEAGRFHNQMGVVANCKSALTGIIFLLWILLTCLVTKKHSQSLSLNREHIEVDFRGSHLHFVHYH